MGKTPLMVLPISERLQIQKILSQIFERVFYKESFGSSLFLSSLKNFSVPLKKKTPDVLHAHAMFFCAIPSLLLGKIFNIPVVYEFRSLWMYQKTNSKNRGFINKQIEIFLIHVEIFCLKKIGAWHYFK